MSWKPYEEFGRQLETSTRFCRSSQVLSSLEVSLGQLNPLAVGHKPGNSYDEFGSQLETSTPFGSG